MKVRDVIAMLQTQDPDSDAVLQITMPGGWEDHVLAIDSISARVDYRVGRRQTVIGEPVEAAEIIPHLSQMLAMVQAGAIGGAS